MHLVLFIDKASSVEQNILNPLIFSVYQKLSATQLENELQNSKVKTQPVELEVITIDVRNATTVENTSLLDSFPPDLFTGTQRNSK